MNITLLPFNRTVNLPRLLNRAEHVFAVASLVVYFNAIVPLLIIQGASEGDGVDILAFNYMPLNMLFLLNYMISAGLLTLRWKRTFHTLMGDPFWLILTIMVPVSILWSVKPDETMSGSIGMIGTVLFGIYLASRFSLEKQLSLFCWTFGIIVALSWVFIVALPKYGIMAAVHAGSLRGVFTHKNGLGKAMVLSTALYILQTRHLWGRSRWTWLGIAGSFSLILGSTSGGALLNSIMVVFALFFLQIFNFRAKYLILASIVLAIAIATVGVWYSDLSVMVLEALGKDATLTGRGDIWPYAMVKILERPWLGYGFNGFWHGENGESIFMIRALRWNLPNSHNGYLDYLLQLGFLGLIPFCLALWNTFVKGAMLLRDHFKWSHTWPIAFLIYLIIINLTETDLLSQNNVTWVFFTTAVLSTAAEFRERFRLRQPEQLPIDETVQLTLPAAREPQEVLK